jgi:hypothetical protein
MVTFQLLSTGMLVLRNLLSNINGSRDLRWVTIVHKLQALLIAEVGLLGFGSKGALNPCNDVS